MNKPILCLDFDGVVHSYISGWKGAHIVPDPPVPGAFDFIRNAQRVFDVCIYSSRSGYPMGIHAMKEWLLKHSDDPEMVAAIDWPDAKPAAFLTIDDRALTFTGIWPDVEVLKKFKPWNKA